MHQYQTAQIKPIHYAAIKKIPVSNQKQVIEESGQPFEALKALQAIKDESKAYALDTPKAKEADAKMMEWLGQNGFSVGDSTPTSPPKEAKKLTKQDYEDALAGYLFMYRRTSGEKQKHYEDAIAGTKFMIRRLTAKE